MTNIGRLILAGLIVIVGTICAMGYMWITSTGIFHDGVVRAPAGHILVHEPYTSHFDLMFSEHGRVSYDFFGERIMVYIALYERDERVVHERVGGIALGGMGHIIGTMLWGITVEEGMRAELRVRADITDGAVTGAVGSGQFDFSEIDFEVGSSGSGLFSEDTEIELGRRYVLHVWQSGSVWTEGDVFNPMRLRGNERTAILYMVFE